MKRPVFIDRPCESYADDPKFRRLDVCEVHHRSPRWLGWVLFSGSLSRTYIKHLGKGISSPAPHPSGKENDGQQ